jgi:hypothetical protein
MDEWFAARPATCRPAPTGMPSWRSTWSCEAELLSGERRYELTAGTLAWLFPGQEHVLVDESTDHALWWAVFRPGLVARIATSPHTRALHQSDPVGRYSRRLDPHRLERLGALFCNAAASMNVTNCLWFPS